MFKKHTDNRRFRHNGTDAIRQITVHPRIDHGVVETRSIVAVYDVDTILQLPVAVDRRVNSQISTLGVSHQPKWKLCLLRNLLQILHRLLLPRSCRKKTHIEIFLPADDRGIRSTVHNVTESVSQFYGHRTELGLFIKTDIVNIICQPDVLVPLRLRHLAHHESRHLRAGNTRIDFFLRVLRKEAFIRLCKRDTLSTDSRYNIGEIHINQF